MKSISFQITMLGNKKRLSFITKNNRHVCVAVIQQTRQGSLRLTKHVLKIKGAAFFIERTCAIDAFRSCLTHIHEKMDDWKARHDKSILRAQINPWTGEVHELHYL